MKLKLTPKLIDQLFFTNIILFLSCLVGLFLFKSDSFANIAIGYILLAPATSLLISLLTFFKSRQYGHHIILGLVYLTLSLMWCYYLYTFNILEGFTF